MDHLQHFAMLERLLDLEAKAEKERFLERLARTTAEAAERAGHALHSLAVEEETVGLGGRYLVSFRKSSRTPLPWTMLDTGSPVMLSSLGELKELALAGVIADKTDAIVQVAFEEPIPESEDSLPFRLDLSFDDVARRRERSALADAAKAKEGRLAELRAILLGQKPPTFITKEDGGPLKFADALNTPQRDAVLFALAAKDLAIIHGPPGTGKTTTLVAVIREAIGRGQKILVTAPSNLGVDNVMQKLVAAGEKAVRIGHPARVMPELRSHSLDLLAERHDDVKLARTLVREASVLFRQASRFTRAAPPRGSRQALRAEARAMLADARKLERRATERILDEASVVCATTTGLSHFVLGPRRFPMVVIDEAGQSTEPQSWIPILRADKVVLAGDHCQLPPTILSVEAQQRGYATSLMERLVSRYHEAATRELIVQYRMNESIMNFSLHEFYADRLQAAPEVKDRLLCQLPGVTEGDVTRQAALFLDTAGAGFSEEAEADGESRLNPKEATLIARRVALLVADGVEPSAIAIISPYAAQVRLLRDQLASLGVEIDSIDGFQGREKDAVLISLVRSNDEREIGFLGEVRRLNVALTRAKRHLFVVGDSATLSSHPFFQRLIEYFESIGAYRTIWEEDPDFVEL